jgi:hypothetical protein
LAQRSSKNKGEKKGKIPEEKEGDKYYLPSPLKFF